MLGFASLITLGIIFGFVFVIVFLIAYTSGYVDMTFVITATIVVNFLGWLISPFFMDLMIRWVYKSKRIELQDLEQRSPRIAAFIRSVCERHNFKIPKLRIIEDDNPTAFAFGSGAFNARLCFSEGLYTYLEEEEMEAVIAHELGHIKRRDFIIMTIASTAVQILYEIAYRLTSRRGSGSGEKKGGAAWIGLLAYVFYFVGTYLLLFLSRTREYGADEFAAHETKNPDALSRALIKIAYGIVAKPDAPGQKHLLNATRALGPFDNQAARNLGTAYEVSKQDWNAIRDVLAYDLVSPWAKILQLQSTHPLTGRRILKLNSIAAQLGTKVSIATDSISTMDVDRRKLYHGFFLGAFIYFLPFIVPVIALAVSGFLKNPFILLWIPGGVGVAMLIKILYKYPSDQMPEATTTLDMMRDMYASPVRGRLYSLEGTVIGRGQAGSYVSEDMMLQDPKGLVYLNYESAFSFIGNFIFALGKVKKLIGKQVSAIGWFFRDVGHHLDLKQITAESNVIQSYPRLWGFVSAAVLIAASFVLYTNAPAWISTL